MVKFTTEELKQRIKYEMLSNKQPNIDTVISNALGTQSESVEVQVKELEQEPGISTGTVAWWKDSFDEKKVGVLIEHSTLQLYKLGRHRFKPNGVPVDVNDWVLVENIQNYDYILHGSEIFLVI